MDNISVYLEIMGELTVNIQSEPTDFTSYSPP